jgi:VWFA-related protein
MLRFFSIVLICGLLPALHAQTPTTADDQDPLIKTNVDVVSALTWVYDANGNPVNGLRADQFKLFDNNKPQVIDSVDVIFHPISMVVCVQANANASIMLPAVSKIGALMKPLVLGDQGEAAVLSFDSKFHTLQNFTSDGDQITAAVKKISTYSGVSSDHMIDAVVEATRMLRTRPIDRRRVLLVIGERRDLGSETRGREALINLQMSNVTLYYINMSQLITKLTAPAPDPRPDVIPPAAVPMPSGVAATPNTVMQTYGTEGGSAQFVPLMVEIFRDAKAIFKTNPADLFTKGTAGEEFSYTGTHSLEQAIAKLSDSLHSSYLINYRPNDKEQGGYHAILVDVDAPGAKFIKSRPGYWLGAKQ